jgi:hypothetical protein
MKIMKPDYHGGSIVNLMSSLIQARGGASLGYAPLQGLDVEKLQAYRHIVLLVVDGLGHRFLTQAAAGSVLRSHLTGAMTSVFPTTTATAITSFLTGQAPQQHGLTGWHTWFRELGCVLAVLPAHPRFGGPGLGDAGIDVGRLYGHVPVFDRLATPSCVVTPGFIAHSDYNRTHQGRAGLRAYDGLDHMFAETARAVREAKAPSYVYAYWPELDRIAHEHGIGSDQAAQQLAEIDAAFAAFLDRMAGSDTLVIVTADHGIIDAGESREIDLADHPALAQSLVLPLCGERRASYCYVRPDRGDDFEHYCRSELSAFVELHASRALIDAGWFGLGAAHPRLAERVGDYTLIMKDNYVIKDRLFNEYRYSQVGVHGGLSEQELYVPLIVAPC